jgi:hypothetical protein
MVMRYAEKIVDRPMKVHDGNKFMNEFRCFRTDDVTSDNFTRLRMTEHFDVAVDFSQAERLSVVVERIGGDEIWKPAIQAFPLGQPEAGHLRIGKDDLGFEAVVPIFRRQIRMNRVPSGNFPLLNGDMDDFITAIDVAYCENMRLRGSHFLVH